MEAGVVVIQHPVLGIKFVVPGILDHAEFLLYRSLTESTNKRIEVFKRMAQRFLNDEHFSLRKRATCLSIAE